MANVAHRPSAKRRRGANPLAAPVMFFAAAALMAAVYIGYVLWPRWPEAPVSLDAPSLPVTVAGVAFNVEPAAMRVAVQRRPGAQDRVDLSYLWPSLQPPDPERRPSVGEPVDPNERLFVTIEVSDGTLPLRERVQTIYPRYLTAAALPGPEGLSLRAFRDDSAYKGEELVYEALAPEHFVARCSRRGVVNAGTCLAERRIGDADITIRFPREWLSDWKKVAAGIDTLMTRLHPN